MLVKALDEMGRIAMRKGRAAAARLR